MKIYYLKPFPKYFFVYAFLYSYVEILAIPYCVYFNKDTCLYKNFIFN